jgi:hypothetical protein
MTGDYRVFEGWSVSRNDGIALPCFSRAPHRHYISEDGFGGGHA